MPGPRLRWTLPCWSPWSSTGGPNATPGSWRSESTSAAGRTGAELWRQLTSGWAMGHQHRRRWPSSCRPAARRQLSPRDAVGTGLQHGVCSAIAGLGDRPEQEAQHAGRAARVGCDRRGVRQRTDRTEGASVLTGFRGLSSGPGRAARRPTTVRCVRSMGGEPREGLSCRACPGPRTVTSYRREWLAKDVVAGVVLDDAARPAGHGVRRARRPAGDHRALHVDPVPARLRGLRPVADPGAGTGLLARAR